MAVCSVCLVPKENTRLLKRDLSAFYKICSIEITAVLEENMLVCSYCSTRISQCVNFIHVAKKAALTLNNVTTIKAQWQHLYPYEMKILNDTSFCTAYCRRVILPTQSTEIKSVETEINLRIKKEFEDDPKNSDYEHEIPVEYGINDVESDIKVKCEPFENITADGVCLDDRKRKSKKRPKRNLSKLTENLIKDAGSDFLLKPVPKKPRRIIPPNYRSLPEEVKAKASGLHLVLYTHEQQLEEIENRKMSAKYIRSLYKCDQCGMSTQREELYDLHVGKHHSKLLGAHECDICHYRFPSEFLLSQHKEDTHVRKWRCTRCDIVTGRWLNHRYWCTAVNEEHECDICNKMFTSRKRMLQHRTSVHRGSKFNCRFCTKSFKLKNSLSEHMKLHAVVSSYDCQQCDERFRTMADLQLHMNTTHPSPMSSVEHAEDLYCSKCERLFKTPKHLEKHMANTIAHWGDKPRVECDICSEKFINKGHLNKHIKLRHDVKMEHICEICQKAFPIKYYLTQHMKTHNPEPNKQRTEVCPDCGISFTNHQALKDHRVAKHAKLKPYECNICNRTFGYRSGLHSHNKRWHGGRDSTVKRKSVHSEQNSSRVKNEKHSSEYEDST